MLGEVAGLEQQAAALRAEVTRCAQDYIARCDAVARVGEGLGDGDPMQWGTLHAAVVAMVDAGFDVLHSVEVLTGGLDALLEATGRALLTAAARDAPLV